MSEENSDTSKDSIYAPSSEGSSCSSCTSSSSSAHSTTEESLIDIKQPPKISIFNKINKQKERNSYVKNRNLRPRYNKKDRKRIINKMKEWEEEDICRIYQISSHTLHNWRKEFNIYRNNQILTAAIKHEKEEEYSRYLQKRRHPENIYTAIRTPAPVKPIITVHMKGSSCRKAFSKVMNLDEYFEGYFDIRYQFGGK